MRFIVFLFLLQSSLSFGQNTFLLTDRDYPVTEPALESYIEYYKDSANTLALKDLRNREFKKIDSYFREIYDGSTYWFRFKILNRSDLHNLWFFEVLDPHIQMVNVYQISANDTLPFTGTGFIEPFSARPTNHKNFVYPIRLHRSDSAEIYFSYQNNYHPNLSISFRPAEQFLDYALNEYYLLGLFYGILLIMAVYNFFIYLSTKESVYLLYVAYVLCYCLNAFREDGIGFQYLWPGQPWFNNSLEFLAPLLLIGSFVFYSKKFLFLSNYARMLNRWIDASLVLYCIPFLLNYFLLRINWINYFYLLPFALIYIGGIITWKRGNLSAKYFLLAFSFLILCFTIVVLRITNIVPVKVYTVYALNFGFLIEVVLFSYALGQRLKIEKDEKARMDKMLILQLKENEKLKDSLNNELEIKVRERTLELASALGELKIKNNRIEELNKLLEQDNKSLNQDIKNITKARLMLKDLTFDEFRKIYPDEDSCLKYLSEIKWSRSYTCKKCENSSSSAGRTPFARRCTRCGYDESVTSFTLFHKSKLPITTSFYLAYLVLANKNISSHELSEKLSLRQKTCWAFKKKILEAINTGKSSRITSKEWGSLFYNQA